MKNIKKLIVSKPMKHNKNADILLFLLSFTKCQCEKNIERTFFVSVGAQKGWEAVVSGTALPQYLPNPKKNISSKIYIYIKYICLTFNWQKS